MLFRMFGIEIERFLKSGKDYMVHSALNKMLSNPEYNVKSALVLSNNRIVKTVGQTTYMPVYYSMFIQPPTPPNPKKCSFENNSRIAYTEVKSE